MRRFDLGAMTVLDKLITLAGTLGAAAAAFSDFIHSPAVKALVAAAAALGLSLGVRPLGPSA